MNEEVKWTVCDEFGYYQSYKNWMGRWQNDWRKDKPSNIKTVHDLLWTKNLGQWHYRRF